MGHRGAVSRSRSRQLGGSPRLSMMGGDIILASWRRTTYGSQCTMSGDDGLLSVNTGGGRLSTTICMWCGLSTHAVFFVARHVYDAQTQAAVRDRVSRDVCMFHWRRVRPDVFAQNHSQQKTDLTIHAHCFWRRERS